MEDKENNEEYINLNFLKKNIILNKNEIYKL